MYLNTKYFLQMYLNTKYIDVFKYFLNTFVNTFLYYFQNIVLIPSIHYKFENERNIRRKINSIIQYVNNITDMHVIYYITCWLNVLFKLVAYRISYWDFVLFNVFVPMFNIQI